MHVTLRLKERNGMLVFLSPMEEHRYLQFKKRLSGGETVEIYLDVLSGNKTLGQLAKVHKVIRAIAATTGHPFEDVKREVKKQAGLYTIDPQGAMIYKSFADCGREELGEAIQKAEEIGQFVGIPMV